MLSVDIITMVVSAALVDSVASIMDTIDGDVSSDKTKALISL